MKLLATLIFLINFSIVIAQPSLTVTTTNCTTWNCSPCDGTFTVTLNNPNTPGPYTYWMYADSAGTILLDSATVAGNSYTFTGICQGYYWTNMTWPLPPSPQPPCTNCVGADTCATCPPGVGNGSGGAGAGGAVGAPCPPISIAQVPDELACFGSGMGTVLNVSFPGATVTWSAGGGFGSASGTGTSVPGYPLGMNDAYTVNATATFIMLDGTICTSSPMSFTVFSVESGFGFNPDQYVCEGDEFDMSAICPTGNVVDENTGMNIFPPFYPMMNTSLACGYPPTPWDCGGTVYTNIIVVPLPTVDAGADQTVCFGEGAILSGSSSDPAIWESGEANGSMVYPSVGVHEYIYTATNSNGCTESDTVQITVLQSYAIDAGPDIVECENVQVALTATSTETFAWNNGVVDGQLFFPAPGEYIVTTTSGGCVGTDTVNVTLNPIPAIDGGPNLNACLGDSVTLSGSGGIGYVWDQSVSDGIPFVPPLGVTWYNLSGTDINGCVGSNAVEVTVVGLPIISAGADQTICLGQPVTLAGSGGQSYVWDNSVTDNTSFSPTSTLTYTVIGEDINGCENTDQVIVNVNSLPIINAGADVSTCLGDSVELNAVGASTLAWSTTTINGAYFTPLISQEIIVSGTDLNGCSNEDTLLITVHQLPTVEAGPNLSVCLGDSVQLFASGASSYSWNNSVVDGLWFFPGLGTTTFTVEGTDSNGCVNNDSMMIIVNGLPAIDAGADQTICLGDPVTVAGSGGLTYSWDNSVINNTSFNPLSTMTYAVIGEDVNGCENTDQVTVNVNGLPVIDAGADVSICLGDSVQLNALGAPSLSWNTATANGGYFTPLISQEVIASGTDLNGCTNSDTLLITVNSLPFVDAGVNQTVCEGDSITVQAVGTGLLSWSNALQNNIPFSQGVGTQTYFVSLMDTNGCNAIDSVIITVEPTPVVSFTADQVEGCSPLNVTFTNTTAGNLTDCLWEISNGDILSGCGSVSSTFNAPGTYDVQLTVFSINGCTATNTETGYIYIEEDPIASFTASPHEVGVLNSFVQMTNYSTGATSYLWDFGDATVGSTLTNPGHVFPSENAGSYQVELIAFSPLMCSDTAYQSIKVNEDLIYFVPNTFTPDGDSHNQEFKPVFTSGFDQQDYHLMIFNRWGEVVFQSKNYEVGWDGVCDTGYCQDGVYTWRIEFKMIDGDERQILHGHVNLLR